MAAESRLRQQVIAGLPGVSRPAGGLGCSDGRHGQLLLSQPGGPLHGEGRACWLGSGGIAHILSGVNQLQLITGQEQQRVLFGADWITGDGLRNRPAAAAGLQLERSDLVLPYAAC